MWLFKPTIELKEFEKKEIHTAILQSFVANISLCSNSVYQSSPVHRLSTKVKSWKLKSPSMCDVHCLDSI